MSDTFLSDYAGDQRISFPSMSDAMSKCRKGKKNFDFPRGFSGVCFDHCWFFYYSVSDCNGLTFETWANEWSLRKGDVPQKSSQDEKSFLKSCVDQGNVIFATKWCKESITNSVTLANPYWK